MFALGIILILLAAGVLLLAVLSGAQAPATFELGGASVTMEPLWVFLTGAMTVLLLVLGLELVRAGARRASKRRKEKKELNRLAEKLEARETREEKAPSQPTTNTATTTSTATTATTATTPDSDADTQATRIDGDVTDPNRPSQ
jgi:uncharacterized membrane protein